MKIKTLNVKLAICWCLNHQVLPPASWMNGGFNVKTKSRATSVLSSS